MPFYLWIIFLDPFWMLVTFQFGSRFWSFPISAYYKEAVLSPESYEDSRQKYFADGGT